MTDQLPQPVLDQFRQLTPENRARFKAFLESLKEAQDSLSPSPCSAP